MTNVQRFDDFDVNSMKIAMMIVVVSHIINFFLHESWNAQSFDFVFRTIINKTLLKIEDYFVENIHWIESKFYFDDDFISCRIDEIIILQFKNKIVAHMKKNNFFVEINIKRIVDLRRLYVIKRCASFDYCLCVKCVQILESIVEIVLFWFRFIFVRDVKKSE